MENDRSSRNNNVVEEDDDDDNDSDLNFDDDYNVDDSNRPIGFTQIMDDVIDEVDDENDTTNEYNNIYDTNTKKVTFSSSSSTGGGGGTTTISTINNNNYDFKYDNNENSVDNDTESNNTNTDNDDVIIRLRRLNLNVQKLTKEAYRQATITTTVPKWSSMSDETKNNRNMSKDDYDASFQLGLALFGQSVTSLEEEVQNQLKTMEDELHYIGKRLKVNESNSKIHNRNHSKSDDSSYGSLNISTPSQQLPRTSYDDLRNDTQKLRTKIMFLKHCSTARTLIDQAMMLSTPALSGSSTNGNELDYVTSSKYIVQATHAISKARKIIDDSGTDGSQSMTSRQAAYTMIESIQLPLRRKKVELLGIARTLFAQCVTLASNSITVRAPNTALRIAYDIFETFSVVTTTTKSSLFLTSTTDTTTQIHQYDSNDETEYAISTHDDDDDDYGDEVINEKVLRDSNSESTNFEMTNTELGLVLRTFTRRLQEEVFNPVLDDMKLKSGKQNKQLSWTFEEVEDNAQNALSTTATTTKLTSLSALIKGTVYRLSWEAVSVSSPDPPSTTGSATTNTTTTTSTSTSTSTASSNTNHNVVRSVFEWNNVFEYMQRIISFVSTRILIQRKSLCAFVAMRFFGKPFGIPTSSQSNPFSSFKLESLGDLESIRFGDDNALLLEPLVEIFKETCVPTYLPNTIIVKELKNRGDYLKQYINSFITKLSQCGIQNEHGMERLSNIAKSFDNVYIKNRRCHLIEEARNLLVQNDYHNTIQAGEDVRPTKEERIFGLQDGMDVFKLHKAAISDTAYKLIQLVRQTMDEATEYHGFKDDDSTMPSLVQLPATLYRTSRDMLDMFRSIIPVAYGNEISTVPRTAGVMHNDCVFLAFHCLIMGLEYKDRFITPSPSSEKETAPSSSASKSSNVRATLLQQTCMFVDMVPSFRDLADRSLGDMLNVQARQLVELVGERIQFLGQSFESDEIVPEWTQAESAVRAGLYHLRHLANTWKTILAYGIYNRSLCYLADVLFSLLLDQVSAATATANRDISGSACQFIHTLFRTTVQDLERDVIIDNDRTASRIWDRFTAIGQFMDMSIVDIQKALSDGFFLQVTAAELTKLIISCFDDTPKRQKLLQMLTSSESI